MRSSAGHAAAALAGPASGQHDIPYEVKRIERTPEKQAIGDYAASLVQDGEAVLLDSGSTTFRIARALRQRKNLSVVTNDLNVAMCLADSPGVQLVVTGGILLESVYTLVGPRTVEELRGLHVDRAFLGADAIDHDAGITNVTFVEVEVKRAMIDAAHQVVVVADSSKFEHRALAPVVCTRPDRPDRDGQPASTRRSAAPTASACSASASTTTPSPPRRIPPCGRGGLAGRL